MINYDSFIFFIYCGAFLGGKIVYILECKSFLSPSLLQGGFSILGASFGGICSLIYYTKKYLNNSLDAIIPISILFLHSFGRLGCFFSGCCGGTFFCYSLYPIIIGYYFFFSILGLTLYKINIIHSLRASLFYYTTIIFSERFIFDPFRFDSIKTIYILTQYQFISIIYIIVLFIIIKYFSFKIIHYDK